MRNWLRMTTLVFVLVPLWQKGQRPVLVAGAGLNTSRWLLERGAAKVNGLGRWVWTAGWTGDGPPTRDEAEWRLERRRGQPEGGEGATPELPEAGGGRLAKGGDRRVGSLAPAGAAEKVGARRRRGPRRRWGARRRRGPRSRWE